MAALRGLVCIDDRLRARAIIPTATRVAELTGAELEFVYVRDPLEVSVTARQPPSGRPGDPVGIGAPVIPAARMEELVADPVAEDHGQVLAQRDKETRERLESELRDVAGFAGVVVLHGRDAAMAIVEYAQKTGVDLIVMATRARYGVAGVLTGSTTQAVIRSGVAPVLVVHPPD